MQTSISRLPWLLTVVLVVACSGSTFSGGTSGGATGVGTTGGTANVGTSGGTSSIGNAGGNVSTHSGGANPMGGGSSSDTGGSSSGVTCGTAVCPSGQYCCNASCGMCAPMGAACIQIACAGTGGAGGVGVCTANTDCKLYDDYCKGCNCRAVPANIAVDPACGSADMVSCLVEPCLNKQTVCNNGQCAVGI